MPERLDRASILTHLRHLREVVQELRRKGRITADDLKGSTETLWFVAHGLQMATQGVVDVAMHMVVALSAEAPDDYRSAIEALRRLHVLDEAFADRIAPMAGLRNILVHGYLRLDADRLADALDHLDALGTFSDGIMAFLAANPKL
jgi:uncharacterized protein YutE (UPF0331/DUF86 family)